MPGEPLALQPVVHAVEFPHVFIERRPVTGLVSCSHGDEQLCRSARQLLAWRQARVVVALLERPKPRGWTGAASTWASVQVRAFPVRLLAREASEVFGQSSHTELSVRQFAVQSKRYG